jgi:hypothetical protein
VRARKRSLIRMTMTMMAIGDLYDGGNMEEDLNEGKYDDAYPEDNKDDNKDNPNTRIRTQKRRSRGRVRLRGRARARGAEYLGQKNVVAFLIDLNM